MQPVSDCMWVLVSASSYELDQLHLWTNNGFGEKGPLPQPFFLLFISFWLNVTLREYLHLFVVASASVAVNLVKKAKESNPNGGL